MFGEQEKRKEVIVTLCHTGDGGAYQLKQYIEQYSNLGMKVIALSISNRSELIKQIMTIKIYTKFIVLSVLMILNYLEFLLFQFLKYLKIKQKIWTEFCCLNLLNRKME